MKPTFELLSQTLKMSSTSTPPPPMTPIRPPKSIFDVLSARPSHQLNVSLADILPRNLQPPYFSRQLPPTPVSPASHPSPPSGPDLRLPPDKRPGGNTMPLGHHSIYFPPQIHPSHLTPDGTDPDHAPPGDLGRKFVRRMWAGGSVWFADGWESRLALDGRRAVCVEGVGEAVAKGLGSKGEKVFVDVERRYGPVSGPGEGGCQLAADEAGVDGVVDEPAIIEVRTLVFLPEKGAEEGKCAAGAARALGVGEEVGKRSRAGQEVKKQELPYQPSVSFSLVPDDKLLFHFSALTLNAHAIHLDPVFARHEGHKGLLFHGPLSLTLMFSILRGELGQDWTLRRIEYRNVAPLYVGERLTVSAWRKEGTVDKEGERRWQVWVQGPEGRLAVKGTAIGIRISTSVGNLESKL